MKLSKVSRYFIILALLAQLNPQQLNAAWYDYFWPQAKTQQAIALTALLAAGYFGQAYYRGTGPFAQPVDESWTPRSHVALTRKPLIVKITHNLDPLIQKLEQHKDKITELLSQKKPGITRQSITQNIYKYVNKSVLPEIVKFIELNKDTIYPGEKEILDRLRGNLKWAQQQKKNSSSLIQDSVVQALHALEQFHQKAGEDLFKVTRFLKDKATQLADVKTPVKTQNVLDFVIRPVEDEMIKNYQLSPNNKYWLENLSLNALELEEKKQLNANDISAFIELINQTIHNLK